jgi:GNAT superfamily N-acetyltransferase
MPESTIIRPIAREDFAEWNVMWLAYNAFYGRSGATRLPTEVTARTWSRFFDSYEPVFALVAERRGQLVGFAHYLLHRSTIQIGPSCYLQDLFTNEVSRGAGVGTGLIEAVRGRAEEAMAERMYWQTHESNEAAKRVYDKVAERSGFIVYRMLLRTTSVANTPT